MIQKVIHKSRLHDFSSSIDELSSWLSRPAEERVAAVDYLRKQHHGSTKIISYSAEVFINFITET
jgi:hypothetical protein